MAAACDILDASGPMVAPGFIDSRVHVAGGSGEGGYRTRTPELGLRGASLAGVTTVIGVLGTDGVARSIESLVAKIYALREEGISAWCYTGSYRIPPPTITGDVAKDIMSATLLPASGLWSRGQPAIAVDTKKKELVGNFKNGGREWRRNLALPVIRMLPFRRLLDGTGLSVLSSAAQPSMAVFWTLGRVLMF